MSKTILAVDDESELLKELTEILSEESYAVVTAKNGKEGLLKSTELDPDLIILDITMPQMDGIEMLSRLRQDYRTAATPVIMLSGSGRTDHIIESMNYGAEDYLSKPFNLDEFLGIIRRKVRK